ncbi:glycosyltransferase family 2 protein [Phocea massiliensis]|uniref:Glycosyltransferase family 2 protein n=1 Tax=Merdimmobilis hominis TaxID=2897707 RepID=A0A938X6D5_9FIRM|nr:glycosyltransferase family A protein [Merdimmobilis hominis]MBM6920227.1 glycosyltransferase family 2 protein [Merdimmobilis hominis]
MPFFTVFIPTYNRAYTLNRCLDSLINQSFKDFEVVVVDDGSTDNTQKIINKYQHQLPIRYFWKENGGKHTAINLGIENAAGEMFIILDSDDYFTEDALKQFYMHWNEIKDKDHFCGIMMRCREIGKEQIHGNLFPKNYFISNYVDFHFVSGVKNGGYGDCCECLRTEILKRYRFPIVEGVRFVPEAYITDQIGLKYQMMCFNEVVKIIEYQSDGITRNRDNFVQKNSLGYLYNVISKLEYIFPHTKGIRLKIKISYWYDYWNFQKMNANNSEIRVKRISFLGCITKVAYPVIRLLK